MHEDTGKAPDDADTSIPSDTLAQITEPHGAHMQFPFTYGTEATQSSAVALSSRSAAKGVSTPVK